MLHPACVLIGSRRLAAANPMGLRAKMLPAIDMSRHSSWGQQMPMNAYKAV